MVFFYFFPNCFQENKNNDLKEYGKIVVFIFSVLIVSIFLFVTIWVLYEYHSSNVTKIRIADSYFYYVGKRISLFLFSLIAGSYFLVLRILLSFCPSSIFFPGMDQGEVLLEPMRMDGRPPRGNFPLLGDGGVGPPSDGESSSGSRSTKGPFFPRGGRSAIQIFAPAEANYPEDSIIDGSDDSRVLAPYNIRNWRQLELLSQNHQWELLYNKGPAIKEAAGKILEQIKPDLDTLPKFPIDLEDIEIVEMEDKIGPKVFFYKELYHKKTKFANFCDRLATMYNENLPQNQNQKLVCFPNPKVSHEPTFDPIFRAISIWSVEKKLPGTILLNQRVGNPQVLEEILELARTEHMYVFYQLLDGGEIYRYLQSEGLNDGVRNIRILRSRVMEEVELYIPSLERAPGQENLSDEDDHIRRRFSQGLCAYLEEREDIENPRYTLFVDNLAPEKIKEMSEYIIRFMAKEPTDPNNITAILDDGTLEYLQEYVRENLDN